MMNPPLGTNVADETGSSLCLKTQWPHDHWVFRQSLELPALAGGGDVQDLAIFRDRSPGQVDAHFLEL